MLIFFENEQFTINFYIKNTFSGIYTNLKIFITVTYKTGLIKYLFFQFFSLCSDFIKFHYVIDKLKSFFLQKQLPVDLVDKCIQEFLDKMLAPKPAVSTVPKK